MTLSGPGIADLAAPETGVAWLVLLTLSHPELEQPLRFTSDGVATLSNGDTFTPFPFELTIPDDVEGRAPRAQLRIDNTSQDIIALLRGLTTPPTLDIRIVRAPTPDVVERSWSGLEWRTSTYDAGAITGTLGVDDLALEEFPYATFDGRFKGLWP
ncbi:MAG: DUF1833 family protein [Defluviicoccus sp.]|nr:MAG: DUF1833 family protein [Defluviicoccus sp.]